jgi:hypothetical protein
LRLIHGAVNLEMDFDPATCNRNFTIAMTDIGEIDFLANLMRARSNALLPRCRSAPCLKASPI